MSSMEIFIAIIIISVILFLLIKGGQSLESRDVTKMLDAELIKYKSQFEQRARLSIKAGDNTKYEFYTNKIQELANEITRRSTGLAPDKMLELNTLIKKHTALVELLMSKKGFTEEQANNSILNKIEDRQRQYQEKGLSEEESLEKAGADVYSIVERQN